MEGYPSPEDEEEEEFLSNMYSLLSSDQTSEHVISALAHQPKRVSESDQNNAPEGEDKVREFMRRRRRLRNYELQRKNNKAEHESKSPRDTNELHAEELQTDTKISNKLAFGGSQEQVKLIQKNVRGWLLRRQFQDTKFAVKILQSRSLL